MEFDFDGALQMALGVHRGQRDKGGAPYILHPMRVALAMKTPLGRVTAVLHDVLEDAPYDRRNHLQHAIRESFGLEVLEALLLLTRADGQDYMDYIRSMLGNRLAVEVKLADLDDNLDADRPGDYVLPPAKVALYLEAWAELLKVLHGREMPHDPHLITAEVIRRQNDGQ